VIHVALNFALRELVDDGLFILTESSGEVSYRINLEKLGEAQSEMNTSPAAPEDIPPERMPRRMPRRYSFWFDAPVDRILRKRTTYRPYKRDIDRFKARAFRGITSESFILQDN